MGIIQHDISKYESHLWLHKLISSEAEYCCGLDMDKKGIEFLKNKGYNVVVANAEDFDLKETFDVIVAGELIEHLQNFERFLISVRKHLRGEGVFIITTPNPFFFKRFLQVFVHGFPIVNPEHTCWFDEITLKQLLRRFDFEVFDVIYTSQEIWYRCLPMPPKLKNTGFVVFAKLSKEYKR